MNVFSRTLRRLKAWMHSSETDRLMDDEMRLHLEMEAQDLELTGLSAEEAHRQAAITFGGVERFKQQARETRPTQFLENISRDVQLAFRQLRRSRGFAISAAALLAVGIGGTVAVFSVLDAIHFRPLPYPNADQLVTIQVRTSDPRCGDRCLHDPDGDEVQAFATNASLVESFGTIRVTQGTLRLPTGARVMKGAAVSESLSDLLALRAVLGRALLASDFRADAPSVIVLSHSTWLSDFGGDSAVIGRSFALGDGVVTVAGVLGRSAELGRPLYAYNAPNTAQYFIADRPGLAAASTTRVITRIRDGRTISQLTAHVDAQLNQRATSAGQSAASPERASVELLRDVLSNSYRSSFWTLFAAVTVVLLITCLNVTGLFLARLTDRANELATRTALGASRSRLAQQIGTETFAVATAGGAGGVFLAFVGTRALRALPAGQLPFWSDISIDAKTMLLAVALTIVAGLILGVAPLFVLSPHRLLANLRDTVSTGRNRLIFRGVLVTGQVALSVVLLGAAGLLTKMLIDAELRDVGTAKHSMMYVLLETPRFTSNASAVSLQQRMIDEVRRVPGVVSVAVQGEAPRVRVARDRMPRDRNAPRPPAMTIEGRADALPSTLAPSNADEVTPSYFETMGTRIVRGRPFATSDRIENDAVAIIDDETARRMFGAQNPIGKRIKFGAASSDNAWMTIVGISATVVNNALETETSYQPRLYRSILQFPAAPSTVLVRFINSSYGRKEAIRTAIHNADPELPVVKMLTVEESIGLRLFVARFNTFVLSGFAAFAVLLSCLGIYAAVTISIAARQREVAIRMALGGVQREVVLLLVRSSTRPIAFGLAVGLCASMFAMHTISSMLYGASPSRPLVYGLVVAVMLTTSAIAAFVPARRAVKVDPARMLRS